MTPQTADVDPRALIRSNFDDGDLYDAHPFDTSRELVESAVSNEVVPLFR